MDANVLGTQITISGIIVAAIQYMKRSKYFPWFTKEKVLMVRGLSAFASFAAALGIHAVWSATDHSLLITGLDLMSILGAAWIAIKQFTFTELTWQTVKPASNPAVVEAVAPEAAAQQGITPEKH